MHPSVHVKRRQQASLDEIVRRIVEAYQPKRVYLFGSGARGDEHLDSDYDLMVIVPDDARQERTRSRLGYQVLRGTGTAVDLLVWTKSQFDKRVHVTASLPATIVREGKLLYKS
jgi:hypothetical protein